MLGKSINGGVEVHPTGLIATGWEEIWFALYCMHEFLSQNKAMQTLKPSVPADSNILPRGRTEDRVEADIRSGYKLYYVSFLKYLQIFQL